MKERPILFSSPMILAILAGTKTVTRRVVKPQPTLERDLLEPHNGNAFLFAVAPKRPGAVRMLGRQNFVKEFSPFQAGQTLWVRETWRQAYPRTAHSSGVVYLADRERSLGMDEYSTRHKWKPSIFLPRWASRITLEIVSVRVERLHDIGKDGRHAKDVLAEGIAAEAIEQERKWFHQDDAPAIAFSRLWESINKKPHPWASNPWIWRIEFRVISPPAPHTAGPLPVLTSQAQALRLERTGGRGI